MDLEVSSGQVEDTDVRESLSRFRLSLFWHLGFSTLRDGMALHLSVELGSGTQGVG